MTQRDYSWITDEMFDRKLNEMLKKEMETQVSDPLTFLCRISPSSYEEIKEYYNNDVLEMLEEERPPMTAQEFSDADFKVCPICRERNCIEVLKNSRKKSIVRVEYECLECDAKFTFKMECDPLKMELMELIVKSGFYAKI